MSNFSFYESVEKGEHSQKYYHLLKIQVNSVQFSIYENILMKNTTFIQGRGFRQTKGYIMFKYISLIFKKWVTSLKYLSS